MRALAPAKVNWTLEVLGKRRDGFHEVRTVLQAIDICDIVEAQPAASLSLEPWGHGGPVAEDLAWRAALVAKEVAGTDPGAVIRIRKVIPVAAGLGGGSSDAAAVLRLLNRLWGLGMEERALASLAAGLSSDAPFFVYGGMALCAGRGEAVTPLPDGPAVWLVVLAPPAPMTNKTQRMYEALGPEDFTDGRRSEALAGLLRQGVQVAPGMVYNAFEGVARRLFPDLESYERALCNAGAKAVHLAGSGPSLFCITSDEREARAIAGRVKAPGATVFVARTLEREASVAVEG